MGVGGAEAWLLPQGNSDNIHKLQQYLEPYTNLGVSLPLRDSIIPTKFGKPSLMAGVTTFISGLWRIATELLQEARAPLMSVFLVAW